MSNMHPGVSLGGWPGSNAGRRNYEARNRPSTSDRLPLGSGPTAALGDSSLRREIIVLAMSDIADDDLGYPSEVSIR